MTFRFARVLTALVALGVAATAAAGNGIRLGGADARLHPFFDVEGRYDSNVAYTAADEAISDLVLHLRPGLELKAPGDVAAVEFHGALDWAQYLGVDSSSTTSLSRLLANAALAASFNRGGAVSPRIDNTFTRQVSGTSLAAASTAVISNQNVLSLALPWRPGGGALVFTPSGQWILETFEKYEQDPGVDVGKLGYNQYRGGAELQWRFLPRTTAVVQGGYFKRSPNSSSRLDDASGFDALAGFTGLLTQRVSATAKAGYGSTTASAVGTLPSKTTGAMVADVSLEWLPMDTLSFRAGYTRSLGLDPGASTYLADGVSGAVKLKLADTVAARVGASWSQLDFQRRDAVGGSAETTFLRIDPSVEGTWGGWLNAAVGYVYSSRTAKWPSATVPDYTKNEAFVRVGVTY